MVFDSSSPDMLLQITWYTQRAALATIYATAGELGVLIEHE